VTGFCCHTQFM